MHTAQSFTRKLLVSLVSMTLAFTFLPATADVLPADNGTTAKVDGLSSETAAASCYEIKEKNPAAPSGTYWLYTPQMDAPAQFYCDQESKGGGWVMIGRGREGWTDQYSGKGDPNNIHKTPSGLNAFSPVQLPSKTIDALMANKPPYELEDGIRLRRALNSQGSEYQEVTFNRTRLQNWSWTLNARSEWNNFQFETPNAPQSSLSYASSTNQPITVANASNSIHFNGMAAQQWQMGFAYGSTYSQAGSTARNSYLYSASSTSGFAIPFAQVFIRPKITQENAGFSRIADQGQAASQHRALPSSTAEPVSWRTSTLTYSQARYGKTPGELNTYVQAIAQSGDYVYVAGDFAHIRNDKTGEVIYQHNIAAFNVHTGEPLRSFRPQLDQQVKALTTLPNGNIVIGGEFSTVNGSPAMGLAVLDPVTGALDQSYTWNVINRNTGGVTKVHSLAVDNNYLYVGGSFTHAQGNTSPTYAYSKNATRYRLSDKSVDWDWRPILNGTVNGINPAADQSTVYAAGYFSDLSGQPTKRLAAINPVNGQRQAAWDWETSHFSTRTNADFQFDVQAIDGAVWTGGSEHIIAKYTQGSYAREASAITIQGGDFQDLSYNQGVIYGSCHCGDFIYEGSSLWQNTWNSPGNTNIYQVKLVGAWDAQTGKVIPDFNPQLSGEKGWGIWETFTDSTGTLWVGGDINRSLGKNGTQKTVGFARFAPADTTPPAEPSDLTVSQDQAGKDRLSWTASPDSGVSYQILRDDRVIATTKESSYTVDHQAGARYFVRAVDEAANYSASTAASMAPAE